MATIEVRTTATIQQQPDAALSGLGDLEALWWDEPRLESRGTSWIPSEPVRMLDVPHHVRRLFEARHVIYIRCETPKEFYEIIAELESLGELVEVWWAGYSASLTVVIEIE